MLPITISLQPINPTLAIRNESQLCYVLITLQTPSRKQAGCAVNWVFIADASRSMRIPIIAEEQFRALVRTGGAQEVLIDGVPVWQLTNPVPPEIKAEAPSALDFVVRALSSVVEQLDHADRFALISCAEEALLLVPGTSGANRKLLTQGIHKLKNIQLGEETDLAQGLKLGLTALKQGHTETRQNAITSPRVDRLILLTDGFTRHPDECLTLARQAALEGVTISTIGLGGEFQDNVLTALADASGGHAVFLRHAEAIPQAVAAELTAARSVIARAITLQVTLTPGVMLRRATRISPVLTPLECNELGQMSQLIHLGDIEDGTSTQVLLEFLTSPIPSYNHPAQASRLRLAHLTLTSNRVTLFTHDVIGIYTHVSATASAVVIDAAARANAVRLQRRALMLAANGDYSDALHLLRAVAIRFTNLGEIALAEAAQREADTLEQTGHITRMGAKELTYGTRRLGERA